MITQEADYKYTLWGETKSPKFKHEREPNPQADWREMAEFTFAPDSKIYEEEDIPRIRWNIIVDGHNDVLVMDCAPDCRSVYWYLESQPG